MNPAMKVQQGGLMSNLSQRLRECAETERDCDQFSLETVSAMEEAADEIDHLMAEVADTNADMLRIHHEKCDRIEELILAKSDIDRLQAENETLRAEMHGMQDGSLVRDLGATCDRYAAQLDHLRAEVEGLKSADANKDWLALVAENKRLRQEVAELKKEAEGGKGLVYFYDKWAAAREKIAILRADVQVARVQCSEARNEADRLRTQAEYWQKANVVLCEQQDRLRQEVASLNQKISNCTQECGKSRG